MKKINWCKKQGNGIKLVDPSDNISKEYYQEAEESLRVLRSIQAVKSNTWLATTQYYTRYFAVYAVLMKIGIKCEIHDCTISLVHFLEGDLFEKGTAAILEQNKKLRIGNQYYLKNMHVKVDVNELSTFLLSIKTILDSLHHSKIGVIRKKIEES